jgi:hypothetical protein
MLLRKMKGLRILNSKRRCTAKDKTGTGTTQNIVTLLEYHIIAVLGFCEQRHTGELYATSGGNSMPRPMASSIVLLF